MKKNDLLGRLGEKGVNPICELCGKNDWTVLEDAKSLTVLNLMIAQPGGGFVVPAPAIPAYGLVCNNCGNVRLHAMAVIAPEEPR